MEILLCRIACEKMNVIGWIEFIYSPTPLTKMLFQENYA